MDPIILVSLAAIIILGAVVFLVLRSTSATPAAAKSHEQKQRELVESYKRRMDEALSPYTGKPELLKKHKAVMLKELSLECSRNVFFGPDEVRGVIAELVHYEPKGATA